jgi:hypothetical protein
MLTARPALAAALAIIASSLAISCNNSNGIFYNVQLEKEQNGTKVFQKTAATNAFKLGSYYYAATSRLYRRAASGVSGDPWDQVDIGGNSYTLRGVVLVGGTAIYALTGTDSTGVSLYQSTDGSTWNSVALPGGTAFDALFAANDQVFAENHAYDSATKVSTYTLYNITASAYVGGAFAPGTDKTIRGVAYDGATYWFASEDMICSGTATNAADASASFDAALMTNIASSPIWGISYAASQVYLGTKGGTLYQGGSGNEAVASVPLTVAVEVPSGAGNILLVGTDAKDASNAAKGYYEGNFGSLSIGSDTAIVAHSSSIYSTTVSSFPVHAFYYDSAAGKLFVCISPGSSSSNYYGLYMSHYNGSSWDGWEAQ